MFRAVCLSSAVALMLVTYASADEVQFKNGDKLTGKIERLEGGKLIITSAVAGEVKVNLADVKTFATDAPIEVQLNDGTVVNQKVVPAEPGRFGVEKGGVAAQNFALADVKNINGPKSKWTGDISAGALITRGNSYTDNASVSLNLMRRSDDDRITFNAAYLYGRQKDPVTGDKVTTTDNWLAQLKYDYFFTPKFYGYGMARVEKNRIADLDLRLTAGVGVGYQWVERPDFNFSTEAGLSWFYESYTNDDKNDHMALRLAYHVDKKFNDQVLVFHNLQYYPSLKGLSDYFITTDAGVRASFTKAMFGEFKVCLDYDSTPAEGASRVDLRYILNVGWTF